MTSILRVLRSLFRWQHGRQSSGYEKMLLATAPWPIPFDCYLLRYTEGASIPPHTDPVEGRKHFRLNIVLKHASSGGNLVCDEVLFETARIKLFRPDLSAHAVTRVAGGSRYVLSFGWLWGKHPAETPVPTPASIPEPIAECLEEAERMDPDVLSFLQRAWRASIEEKESDPDDWTPLERSAYANGDWQLFSRMRGYTEEEIANFGEFMRLAHLLDARYGDDFAICLHHELTQLDPPEFRRVDPKRETRRSGSYATNSPLD